MAAPTSRSVVPGRAASDSGGERPAARGQQSFRLRRRLADGDRRGGVRVEAVQLGRDVDREQLPRAQHARARDAVHDLVVDAQADGARVAVGEDRAGARAVALEDGLRDGVELRRRHARHGGRADGGDRLRHHAPDPLETFELLWRVDGHVSRLLSHTQGVDLALLDEQLAAEGEPRFRSRQVWEWAARGAGSLRRDDEPSGRAAAPARGLGAVLVAARRAQRARPRRHGEGAVRDGRRPAARGGADALPRRAPLALPVEPVGLPAHLHLLRDRPHEVRPQPHDARRSSTRRSTSGARSEVNHAVFMGMGEPLMNLDNVLATCERLPEIGIAQLEHRHLDRRLDPRHRADGDGGAAGAARTVAARARGGAALGADAGQRALPAARRARRLPALARAPAPSGLRRVPDAGRRQRPLRAGRAAGRAARAAPRLQGQPDPVQPHRRPVPGLRPGGDRGLPRRAHRSAACARRCGSRAGATSTPPAASWRRAPSRACSGRAARPRA